MLLKSVIIFVTCNYMREILNINLWKVYVNYKTLFIGQGSCVVVASSRENRSNKMSTFIKHSYRGELQIR